MKVLKLGDMTAGWFIGDFTPAVLKTSDFEAACKYYRAGDAEARHVHRIATEITVIASGSVRMNSHICRQGDIIVLQPDEATDFTALEDTVTVVIKVPSAPGDKRDVR